MTGRRTLHAAVQWQLCRFRESSMRARSPLAAAAALCSGRIRAFRAAPAARRHPATPFKAARHPRPRRRSVQRANLETPVLNDDHDDFSLDIRCGSTGCDTTPPEPQSGLGCTASATRNEPRRKKFPNLFSTPIGRLDFLFECWQTVHYV